MHISYSQFCFWITWSLLYRIQFWYGLFFPSSIFQYYIQMDKWTVELFMNVVINGFNVQWPNTDSLDLVTTIYNILAILENLYICWCFCSHTNYFQRGEICALSSLIIHWICVFSAHIYRIFNRNEIEHWREKFMTNTYLMKCKKRNVLVSLQLYLCAECATIGNGVKCIDIRLCQVKRATSFCLLCVSLEILHKPAQPLVKYNQICAMFDSYTRAHSNQHYFIYLYMFY